MRELLRSCTGKVLLKFKSVIDNFREWRNRREDKNLPEEVTDQYLERRTDTDDKRLNEQELRAKQQKRELEEAQARIKFLHTQLNALAPRNDGSRRR